MRSDDFMFYYADIFVSSVQYGNRVPLCDKLKTLQGESDETIFNAMIKHGEEAGVKPVDYDTALLADTKVNTMSAGRQWTYQYCTEYGFF